MKKLGITTATIGAAALTFAVFQAEADGHKGHKMNKGKEKVKCYGVAEAGENDCGNGEHGCAGYAKEPNLPNEWKYKSKAMCKKMGGKLSGPKKG